MRRIMKTTLAALALIPMAATAVDVRSPMNGTVTATTYYSSGAFHGAVDISDDSCNHWSLIAPIAGTLFWDITIRTTGVVCYGSGSGTQNEAKHTFSDGYTFRLWHFIKTADSYDRTCDRCALGNVGGTGNVTGPTVHLQRDKLGTNDTSWYTVVKGQNVTTTTIIGRF